MLLRGVIRLFSVTQSPARRGGVQRCRQQRLHGKGPVPVARGIAPRQILALPGGPLAQLSLSGLCSLFGQRGAQRIRCHTAAISPTPPGGSGHPHRGQALQPAAGRRCSLPDALPHLPPPECPPLSGCRGRPPTRLPRGVAAASSGTAHFSSSAWVAASAPPRAPKYRAACARSMPSGFSSRSGILGPMLICPPSFTRIKNRLSIQHPRFPVNAKHRIYFCLQLIAFASNLRYTVKKECDRYG